MAEVDVEKYKPNSYKSKAEEKKKNEKVVKGEARIHQKSTGEKIKEVFFGEGVDNVSDYLLFEILIPSFKELMSDFVTKGVDMLLFGEARGGTDRRKSRGSYVAYDSYSRKRDQNTVRRARFDFSDVEFDSRNDALDVLDAMSDALDMYDVVSVADLYEFSGITPVPVDHNWGWTNINTSRIEIKRNGKYILVMPNPKALS